MVELVFGDFTALDIALASFTGLAGGVVVAIAYRMAERGVPKWKPRKLVHISMGTIIALTVMHYSNLSGPSLAAGIFLTVLLYAWAHKSDLISELLLAGSRETDKGLSTFAAGFMGMVSFATVFLLFFQRPEIIVAAILTVSWGDAAGEVIGRPYGGRVVKARYRGKSLEGTVGVILFAFLSISVSLVLYSADVLIQTVLPQVALIALVLAVLELVSVAWTDNLLLPLGAALLMWQLLFPATPFWFLTI
jgi:dolichol kinase